MDIKSQHNHPEFSLEEVIIRVVRSDEVPKWNALMNEHHYLGFKQLVGRGIRYVAEHDGEWLAIAAWQAGAFQCAPRDRWIKWKKKCQFRNLHLIGNNTRFLILGEAGKFPNLASHFLSCMTKRLSEDWMEHYGHGLLLAESFVDPAHFDGAMYKASNWKFVGRSKGYARSNGRYTDPHGKIKELYVYPLRRNAKRMLCNADSLGDEWKAKRAVTRRSDEELSSLYEALKDIPDFRRGQGRKHRVECVMAIYILSVLCGNKGAVAAAQYGKSLSQKELALLGAWYNKEKQRYEAPSEATMHRVVKNLDTQKFQRVISRFTMPQMDLAKALAIDGKRIRGANRNGGNHYEVVTLVDHVSGMPLGSLDLRDEGGEIAAVLALLEEADVEGKVITLDALHTTKKTADVIVRTHKADYMFTVKGNSSAAYERLKALEWESDATGHFTEKMSKGHGRIEQRSIKVMNSHFRLTDYPHVKQVFKVRRWSKDTKTGKESLEDAYGITSVNAENASPRKLLEWNRGHWAVESKNHYRRDVTFGEDGSPTRVNNGPANNAVCNNIALAVILGQKRKFKSVPRAVQHFSENREEALRAIGLSP